eukprot:303191_1
MDLLSRESSMRLIRLDLDRTFPCLQFFRAPDGPLYLPLMEVLGAFACYRPDMGYVQGMSYLAAVLLLNMDSDNSLFSVFTAFANLINRYENFSTYSVIDPCRNENCLIFNILFREYIPELSEYFEQLGISSDMYFIGWIIPLFSGAVQFDIATRIWDNYLFRGHKFLFRTALG